MIRPRHAKSGPEKRLDDELPLSLRELAQLVAIVAVLVFGAGAWLVGAGANKWVGIVLVAVGVGAIGWWCARTRVDDSAEGDGESDL